MGKDIIDNDLTKLIEEILEIKLKYKGKATEMLLACKWEIGEKILADRGQQIDKQTYRELEVKTGISNSDLVRCVAFKNTYPNKDYPIISWRKLRLGITDETEDEIIIDIPEDEYQVYVIDPPWQYKRKYDPQSSRVASPYKEVNTEIILTQLKDKLKPYKDSIMFLWTTHRFIWDAKMVLDKLGFIYKACLVWNKEKIGMGSWFRMQCEFCLFAVKGKPKWSNTIYRDIITERRREHSRKPESFYDMVRELTPDMKRAYIFTRENIQGFDGSGDECEKLE